MNDTKIKNEQNSFTKLMTGNYRLVDVFWTSYVLIGFMTALIISKLESVQSIIIGDCLNAIYLILISVAVWNSASKYNGKKLWSVLAKISAVLVVLSSIISLAAWGYHIFQG